MCIMCTMLAVSLSVLGHCWLNDGKGVWPVTNSAISSSSSLLVQWTWIWIWIWIIVARSRRLSQRPGITYSTSKVRLVKRKLKATVVISDVITVFLMLLPSPMRMRFTQHLCVYLSGSNFTDCCW